MRDNSFQSMKRRRLLITALVVTILFFAAVFFMLNCPAAGIAFSHERRELHRFKNRAIPPAASDFNPRVSLPLLLQPGDDRNRWSQLHAARVEGYVVSVATAKPELTNCFCGRDIHLHIGTRSDAPPREHFVTEITPRISPTIIGTSANSVAELRAALVGRWVRIEGWLFFDEHHTEESENFAPGREGNWRASPWEIHPVTKIEVIR